MYDCRSGLLNPNCSDAVCICDNQKGWLTICPHCKSDEGMYIQRNGYWACINCYFNQEDLIYNAKD